MDRQPMVRKPLNALLVLQAALEYLRQHGDIRLSEDEPKDYDPKGFHVGPREGHYFKPGEREAGGKEVEIVQAPEATVQDNPGDLTKKEFNRKYVWHHTSSENAEKIKQEGMKKGVFGIGGRRGGYPGDVTVFARRSDVEALDSSVESFGQGQALYPKGTYSPTKEWETPLSADKLFFVPRTEKDPHAFLSGGSSDSTYEMPKYDFSFDAYSQQYPDDVKFHNLTEADFEHYERMGMQPDSKVAAISDNIGATLFFGKTKEEAVEKLLTRQINKGVFLPPRLTPKPDWASDADDPFPEIPSDIKELHYDDIPDFYSKHTYGDALELEQSGGFKGIVKRLVEKAGEKDDIQSETFTDAFAYGEDGEIDYVESAKKMANKLGRKVTPGVAKSFVKQMQAKTQDSLLHRGLPEKFYVFKGGKSHGENQVESTSLSPDAASKNYFSQKETEPYVAMYAVNRADVLVDVNAIKHRYAGKIAAEDEQELVLHVKDLKNPVMIKLPNYMIKAEFYKSKSNDLSKLLTLETALELMLSKQQGPSQSYAGSHVPPEKRVYHTNGKYVGPQQGRFSELGVDVDAQGNWLNEDSVTNTPDEVDLQPGQEQERLVVTAEDPVSDDVQHLIDELSEEDRRTFDSWQSLISEVNDSASLEKYLKDVGWRFKTLSERSEEWGNSFNELRVNNPDLFDQVIAGQEYAKISSIAGYSKTPDEIEDSFLRGAQSEGVSPGQVQANKKNQELLNQRRRLLVETGNKDILALASEEEHDLGVRIYAAVSVPKEYFFDEFESIAEQLESNAEQDLLANVGLNKTGFSGSYASLLVDHIMNSEDSDEIIEYILDRYSEPFFEFNTVTAGIFRDLCYYAPAKYVSGKDSDFRKILKRFDNVSSGTDQSDPNAQIIREKLVGGNGDARTILTGRRNALGWLNEHSDIIPHFRQTWQLKDLDTWTVNVPAKENADGEMMPSQDNVNVIDRLVDLNSQDPSSILVNILDELYRTTEFGWLHLKCKDHWEASSDSVFGGILKDVVGNELNEIEGKDTQPIVFHQGGDFQDLSEGANPDELWNGQSKQSLNAVMQTVRSRVGRTTDRNQLIQYAKKQKDLTRHILDVAYPDTDEFTLYRGLKHQGLWNEATDLNYRPVGGKARQNPLSSWSLRENLAEKFAGTQDSTAFQYEDVPGIVLTTEVHKDHIWSIFATHAYNGNEREFIVMSNPSYDSSMQARAVNVGASSSSSEEYDYYDDVERDEFQLADTNKTKVYEIEPGGNANWIKWVRDDIEGRHKTPPKKDSNNLSKLLTLETALELLVHKRDDSQGFLFQKSIDNVVKVGDVDIPVELALDPVKGLSGRGSMNPGTGMLFSMPNACNFWMKDMKFPLDIIWINDKREVVDISENLPVPTSSFMPLYSPRRFAVYALEINGGEAKALGLNIGDAVEINVS